ncbi:D-alanyl-D-alanine carboxypeptidase/D-alanyl-D-alanine-endopeptidase [Rhodococcus sp. HNM0569]|uniref:D-alanyl-D-alanine carboxypeptidase/D-alanyl-D-alanine endopeptidase n=1 Tax=Rhodococcus sp. HNM0569 TaxID=2716340 RepID=UPI00146D0EEE|nr:D-alanyl-D-alanine carboxypeptidase/D-alanyl-D-alanine-endopeptidase [Rhodococcus sp. HNM0569]NLU82079.1 D-alanyl-D-alanine carboxypeptidase/D-alanyl-D-alanine-endopeptidase [Rhodococcus sp. HNM0569]
MRILIVTVLVLAVAVAAVVVAVQVSRNSEDARVAPAPELVDPQPRVVPLASDAPLPGGVAAALGPAVADPALGAFTGSVRDALTGDVLWSAGESTPMTPASTTKVLTAAAALLTLPADQRLETKVVAGTQPGQIVLVAAGDPTLTSLPVGQTGYYPGAAHLSDLVDQVRASGTDVQSVAVDASIYGGPNMATGWFPEDIGAGYITPTEPVMIDGGRADPRVDESPRSATPALDAGKALASALGLDPAAVTAAAAPVDATAVATVRSAPLRDRLRQMMEHSDNVLAEAVGREVAVSRGKPVTFDGAASAVVGALSDAGFDMTGVVLHDTSGLSVDDRVTARALDDVLTAAAGNGDPRLRALLDYLPVAGSTGSLSDRYASGNRVGAGWVRAKTGTLSEASGLAGYVVDQDGRALTFALLSNGRPPEVSRPALDTVAATLRTCGCP